VTLEPDGGEVGESLGDLQSLGIPGERMLALERSHFDSGYVLYEGMGGYGLATISSSGEPFPLRDGIAEVWIDLVVR
jgi:hypothetical protein